MVERKENVHASRRRKIPVLGRVKFLETVQFADSGAREVVIIVRNVVYRLRGGGWLSSTQFLSFTTIQTTKYNDAS